MINNVQPLPTKVHLVQIVYQTISKTKKSESSNGTLQNNNMKQIQSEKIQNNHNKYQKNPTIDLPMRSHTLIQNLIQMKKSKKNKITVPNNLIYQPILGSI